MPASRRELAERFDRLDPVNLDQLLSLATDWVAAGLWTEDTAQTFAMMTVQNHGNAGVNALANAVEAAEVQLAP